MIVLTCSAVTSKTVISHTNQFSHLIECTSFISALDSVLGNQERTGWCILDQIWDAPTHAHVLHYGMRALPLGILKWCTEENTSLQCYCQINWPKCPHYLTTWAKLVGSCLWLMHWVLTSYLVSLILCPHTGRSLSAWSSMQQLMAFYIFMLK